jgi:hypothetical protein
MKTFQDEIERVPGTQYYAPDRTLEQSDAVKKLIANVSEENAKRLEQQAQTAAGNQASTLMDDDSAEQERLQNMIHESRKAQLESVVGKTAEQREQENAQLFAGFLTLAAPLVILGAIFLLWGFFYFPAACAVAGYTRSFMATINPLVGLDTIKRLGMSYVKILLMGLTLIVGSAVIGSVLGLILSPFDIPGMGNLPAKAVASLFGFYFSVVFSCIIGYALFKSADKLKLYR